MRYGYSSLPEEAAFIEKRSSTFEIALSKLLNLKNQKLRELRTFDEVNRLLKPVCVAVAVVEYVGSQFDAGKKVGLIIQPVDSVQHALQGLVV